ncbi:hypothetical protein PENTCL1PPCAC_28482, partial [Pristionchus entomophagus]
GGGRYDMDNLFDGIASNFAIGLVYMSLGVLGIVVNMGTVIMIVMNRVYRLSAYTLMANIALADSVILFITGVACGWSFVERDDSFRIATNATLLFPFEEHEGPRYVLSALHVSAWMAALLSYALLGLNRCIAIRYYGTRAKALNRMPVAISGSLATWAIGMIIALTGTFPSALMGIRQDMFTWSFLEFNHKRSLWFFIALLTLNLLAISGQWICSILVLLKIRYVKKKISRNKLNQNSANRFRKQAKLTFQFFYPSLLCTLSSVVLFSKPFLFDHGLLNRTILIILHVIWLVNHTCNPFIYAYFNDRMRLTYGQLMTCSQLRYEISKRRVSHTFTQGRHTSRRSNGQKANRMSTRSTRGGTTRDGNFVRNSLQMQSRDFEQLCEFMMRVNPFYDSSEGWRESSDEEEEDRPMSRELSVRAERYTR